MSLPSSTNLAKYVTALKANKATATELRTSSDALLFWGTSADTAFLQHLKGCVGGTVVHLKNDPVISLTQIQLACSAKHVTKLITTNIKILSLLLRWTKRAAPSLADYAGSYFKIAADPRLPKSVDIEVVFIPPLKQLVTVSYGSFLTTRYISKLTKPEAWFKVTPFTGYTLLTPEAEQSLFPEFQTANLICMDLETLQENAVIRCVSYTAAWFTPEGIITKSCVLALTSDYALAVFRKWNWELKAPKIFQNGKYDIAYAARYNAPVYNYLYDTANLFHCWYSELPKDLGFLNSFFVREAFYWKDLANTSDLDEYYRYNSLDTWGTLFCFLAMVSEAPAYATANYLLEFPLTFPCHLSEMTGIKRDVAKLAEARAAQEKIISAASAKLDTILSMPVGSSFNVMSPVHMKSLLKLLGCSDLSSTGAADLKKARFRHPLNARIIALVLEIRKARKLVSTYITAGNEFNRLDGTGDRILYALNPHGTDSGRLASKSHHFWKGINIQNIPRGPIVKQTLIADPDFLLAECDLEQAESRDTAYISGDEQLIHNVEHSPDFHSANASAFFGVPFERIYDVVAKKVIDKALRDLAKPVNHGANYNMGAMVLITSMGEENIIRAKRLLNLPSAWGLVTVAEYLLAAFHKTYPSIKGVYYPSVVAEVETTRKLTSKAIHWYEGTVWTDEAKVAYESNYATLFPTTNTWTRYCFGKPSKNKLDLNSYISHPPQSLNAQTLNKAYMRVFNNIAMHPEYAANFKLLAQIHDSILFQYRIGHDYLCDKVKACMEIPITIKASDNKVRSFIVPSGIKRGKHLPSPYTGKARSWAETE